MNTWVLREYSTWWCTLKCLIDGDIALKFKYFIYILAYNHHVILPKLSLKLSHWLSTVVLSYSTNNIPVDWKFSHWLIKYLTSYIISFWKFSDSLSTVQILDSSIDTTWEMVKLSNWARVLQILRLRSDWSSLILRTSPCISGLSLHLNVFKQYCIYSVYLTFKL